MIIREKTDGRLYLLEEEIQNSDSDKMCQYVKCQSKIYIFPNALFLLCNFIGSEQLSFNKKSNWF